MAGETVITVVGNLVDDPELRFTPSGAAVANFRIASTPRTFDQQTNEWKDGEALFLSCSVWRQAAENVAESLQKGMRVVVAGPPEVASVRNPRGREAHRLRDRRRRGRSLAEVRHGQGHPHHALRRWRRVRRPQGGGRGGGGQQGGGDDPWATPAPQGGGQQAHPRACRRAHRRGPAAAGGQDPWGAPGVGSDEPRSDPATRWSEEAPAPVSKPPDQQPASTIPA